MTNISIDHPNGNSHRRMRQIDESLLDELAAFESQGFRIVNSAANHTNSGAHTGAAYDSRILSSKGQAAVRLTKLGFFVTPLCWPTPQGGCGCPKHHTDPKEIGKAPLLGSGYEEQKLTLEEVIALALQYPKCNWGILLKHSGLFVLDSDSEKADHELERREVPPGPRVKTAHGWHRYFRNTSGIIGRTVKRGESRTLDIFSDGYVVAPGSIHQNGAMYVEEVTFEECELEDPPTWAIALLKDSKKLDAEVEALPEDLASIDLDTLTLPAWVKEVIREGHTIDPKYPSRSEAVFAVLVTLLKARCTTAIIASVLLDPRYKISEKPREQGRKWLASDIARARLRTDEEEQQRSQTQAETLPSIQTNNRPLRDISDDALRALLRKNDPPSLFVRAGTLARSVTDERDRPIIEAVGEPALRGYLTRSAEFIRITAKDDKKTGERTFIETHVPPPKEVVQDILSLALKPFPPLVGVVESPVFRPDGSILSSGGYDPTTRLLYHPTPGFLLPSIKDKPTADDAARARTWLQEEMFSDFPFAAGADVANFYGALLTPIVRPAIQGNAPLGLIDKPGPGSGATLLADLIATVASGTLAAKLMAPEGRYAEEEWKKRITSFLLLNSAHVGVIDNIEETALSSGALSSLLTAGEWQDRLLGGNTMVTLPVRCTLIATGNNIALRGDVARRCYRVWLDPRMERPWTREGFKHADLLGWTKQHRGKILAALFTMARAWFVAGQPAPAEKLPTLGMFEEWVRIIGGILAFSGLGGFLENQEALYEQVDDEGPEWRKFLEAWFELWGDRWVTVRYFCGVLSTLPTDSALFQALPEKVEWEPDKLEGSRIKLGKALKKHAFRVYGNYRLERNDENKKAKSAEWKVSLLRSEGSKCNSGLRQKNEE